MSAERPLTDSLAVIRDQFVASLPAQIAHLRSTLATVADATGDTERQDLLRQACLTAHSLAGTAGTFGYPALGRAAKALETSLREAIETPGHLDAPRQHAACLDSLISQADAATRVPLPAQPHPSGPSRPHAHAGSVILIEDDPALANRLSAYLHHFGYEIRHFDCATAFTAVADTLPPPTALLIDNALPEGALAGIQAAITRPDSMRDTPMLFMSANDSQAARIGALRAGGQAYLLKPIEPSQVLDALENVVEAASGRPHRVLILDDDPAMVAHHSAVLGAAGFDTVELDDPSRLIEAIREQPPDIVLLDLYMPDTSGSDLAAMIHQILAFAGVPILFVSAEHDIAAQQAAMLSCGGDFLIRPVAPDRLVSAVRYRAVRHRQLRELMKNDSLTGLLDHASLKERLSAEMHRVDRHGGTLSVAMLDIDHFKQVNDRHGHAVGDRILRELAMLLRRRLRSSDVAGRYGGEEFAILLPNTGAAAAVDLLNAIREDFGQISHFVGEQMLRVTFSVGIASQSDWGTPETLLMAADAALYTAKHAGRDRVILASPVR
ncbi:MAG: diguanylate cyclase [Rhodocyclaceae bacterium]